MYTVYKHTTPNNKVYIGITRQSLNNRWRRGKGYERCRLFNKAIQKYGWENIKHEVIKDNLTEQEALDMEIDQIKKYKSDTPEFGYNISHGGNYRGKCSEETKKIISAIHKGKIVSEESKEKMRRNHADVKGANNPNYGRKFSEEIRKRMSLAQKGKQAGDKNPMFGRNHSEEARKIQSENRKNKCVGANNHKSRKVLQYDTKGNLIGSYECIRRAEEKLHLSRGCGGHISSCAQGKLKTAYGYIWRYAEPEV